MNPELILRQLEQVRAHLQLVEAQIQTIEATLAPAKPEAPADGECPHPKHARQPAAAMGNPHRELCGACGKFLKDAKEQQK